MHFPLPIAPTDIYQSLRCKSNFNFSLIVKTLKKKLSNRGVKGIELAALIFIPTNDT